MKYKHIIAAVNLERKTDKQSIKQCETAYKKNIRDYIISNVIQHYKSLYYLAISDKLLTCKNEKALKEYLQGFIKYFSDIILKGNAVEWRDSDMKKLSRTWEYQCQCRLIEKYKWYLEKLKEN